MRLWEGVKRIGRAVQIDSIEVFIAILCFLSGIPILINPGEYAPTSVLSILPYYLALAWAVALVLGGLLNVIGIMASNPYLRRAGLILVASGAFVMGLTVLFLTGTTRLLSTGIFFVFSWAMGAQYFRLGKQLKLRRKFWEQIRGD